MITKEQFVKIINRLRDYNDLQDKIQDLFRENIDNREMDFMNAGSICIGHETIVVQLLENMFNDKDTLSYWLYELDYGRKYTKGCFTDENDKEIDISTASYLYNYLFTRNLEKERENADEKKNNSIFYTNKF